MPARNEVREIGHAYFLKRRLAFLLNKQGSEFEPLAVLGLVVIDPRRHQDMEAVEGLVRRLLTRLFDLRTHLFPEDGFQLPRCRAPFAIKQVYFAIGVFRPCAIAQMVILVEKTGDIVIGPDPYRGIAERRQVVIALLGRLHEPGLRPVHVTPLDLVEQFQVFAFLLALVEAFVIDVQPEPALRLRAQVG